MVSRLASHQGGTNPDNGAGDDRRPQRTVDQARRPPGWHGVSVVSAAPLPPTAATTSHAQVVIRADQPSFAHIGHTMGASTMTTAHRTTCSGAPTRKKSVNR